MPKRKKSGGKKPTIAQLRKQGDAAYEADRWDDVIRLYTDLAERQARPDGELYFRLGNAYREKGEYDKAIDCYRKAVDTPGFERCGSAWNNMGIAYSKKGEYDKAIDCWRKALDTPGYDNPGRAWYNMGVAYDEKGEYDNAIDCYRKAVDTPGYDNPGSAWNNMGVAYSGKGDHEKAIEYYRKAVDTPGYDDPGSARYNMGLALLAIGTEDSLVEAETCFTRAAHWFRSVGRETDAEHADAQAQLVAAVQAMGKDAAAGLYPALSAAKPLAEAVPEYDPLEEIRKIESDRRATAEEYEAAFRARKPDSVPHSAVVCLKGWSSSEPILTAGSRRGESICGGGLFLRWQGKGVVIDPGVNFVSNFRESGYFVQDIDALVVTHDHVDHTFDLIAINDLLYTMRQFEEASRKRYCFFSEPVHNKHKEWESLDRYTFDVAFNERLERAREPRSQDGLVPGVSLNPFPTDHEENSFGIRCVLEQGPGARLCVGFTSDTAFSKDLVKNLKDCHLIVANMSAPDSKEYADPEHVKQDAKHLGLNGVRKLIEGTDAQVYVITEFWAGRGDVRVPLCQLLVQRLSACSGVEGKCIIPADVGMTVELGFGEGGTPRFTMKCTSCGVRTECPSITTVRPDEPNGPIRYLCPRCMSGLTLRAT